MKTECRISTGHLNPKQTSTASNRLSKTISKWEPPASAPPGATLWVPSSGILLEFPWPRSATVVPWSVPAFLLAETSAGPRASGEVVRRLPLADLCAVAPKYKKATSRS